MYEYKRFNNRPDPSLEIEDCVIRSTSFASGCGYRKALELYGKTEEYDLALELDDPAVFFGVKFEDYKAGLSRFANKPKKMNAVVDGKVLALEAWTEFSKKFPEYTFVFCVRSKSKAVAHVTACRNGSVYDCWDEHTFRGMDFRVMDVVVFQNR